MISHYKDLLDLLEKFPVHFSASAIETVRDIANRYSKILKTVMHGDNYYEMNAEDFPNALADIEDDLQKSLYGKRDQETIFWNAVKDLKADIKDFAEMMNEQEGLN
ncbi:MAG: hypothetical protein ABIY51_11750 [Ferruginibacter sp.]